LDRAELAPYATLRQHEEHRRAGIFVAEGAKVVRRLLQSDFGVLSVLLPEKRLAEFEPLIRARPEDVPVYIMEIAELEKLTGFPFFQGVLAVGKVPRRHTIESICDNTPRPHFFVALDGLANAENVGLIVRNCAAFGVHALIVGETSSSPFLRRAVRNSMGTIFKLPIVECGDLPPLSYGGTWPDTAADRSAAEKALTNQRTPSLLHALEHLRAKNVPLIAAHPHAEQRLLQHTDFTIDCCIVLGSEGVGLSAKVLAVCDESIAIPMSNDVDSLNVASAAAVFFYEVMRQRGRGGC
jgi:tRNA G18 (ribose-2'-O)-methylase SpoU